MGWLCQATCILLALSLAGPAPAETPIIVDGGIPQPLTTTTGDPVRGQALVRDMSRASCLICHAFPLADEPDQGDLGPPLAGIAARLTAPELRLRLVDARRLNPDTVMPPYHALDGLTRVAAAYAGQPIYSAQEVEDVLAWLLTLKMMRLVLTLTLLATAGTAQTPHEVEGRKSGYLFMSNETRALQDDDFLNPGFFAIDQGVALWTSPDGPVGLSCAGCHQDPSSLKGVAARYPMFDTGLGRMMSLETRINHERETRLGAPPWDWESSELLAMTALISLQSRGLPMEVSIDGAAAPHFEAGRAFYLQKRGQLNLSCADCHDDRAGLHLRGDLISQGQVNAFPVYRLLWDDLGSRQRMFVWCNTSIRAEPYAEGAPEYLDLELYLAWRGRGLPIEAPGVRR